MDVRAAVEEVFRRESGRIIAGLIRCGRSFDLAEEALQEAYAGALATWAEDGLPANPSAWITSVAQRKLVDALRREQTRRKKEDQLLYEPRSTSPDEPIEPEMNACADDRLSLMFTCCHPAINRDAQVGLTLRTLGGLSTPEIAKAFLIPEATLAQRLVRAKKKIQEARIPYAVPGPELLPDRLASVQAVLYLIFNEGYLATTGDHLVRADLCEEAIRLARVLCELMPEKAENYGLLALMLLHDSRRAARLSADGELVTLEEQDRSLWRRDRIEEGLALIDGALRMRSIGPYQLQAAIAAVHASAKNAADTDWPQIAALYELLACIQPSPVVFLNHAAAIAMTGKLDGALEKIEALAGALGEYYLFHAARADVLRRMGREEDAMVAYRRALELTANGAERRFLLKKLGLNDIA